MCQRGGRPVSLQAQRPRTSKWDLQLRKPPDFDRSFLPDGTTKQNRSMASKTRATENLEPFHKLPLKEETGRHVYQHKESAPLDSSGQR